MKSPIPMILMSLGVVCILLSFLWPMMFRGEQVWTEDKAKSFQEASANLHDLSHQHTHDGEDDHFADPMEIHAAKKRFEAESKQLEKAQKRGSPTVLRVLGVVFAAVGIIVARIISSNS